MLNVDGIRCAKSQDMGVNRFEDLRVWQGAREQCDRVGALIKRPEFRGDAVLADQTNAASISVMFNISEGFLRRRDKETMRTKYQGPTALLRIPSEYA